MHTRSVPRGRRRISEGLCVARDGSSRLGPPGALSLCVTQICPTTRWAAASSATFTSRPFVRIVGSTRRCGLRNIHTTTQPGQASPPNRCYDVASSKTKRPRRADKNASGERILTYQTCAEADHNIYNTSPSSHPSLILIPPTCTSWHSGDRNGQQTASVAAWRGTRASATEVRARVAQIVCLSRQKVLPDVSGSHADVSLRPLFLLQ
jgi:hypothetical protein